METLHASAHARDAIGGMLAVFLRRIASSAGWKTPLTISPSFRFAPVKSSCLSQAVQGLACSNRTPFYFEMRIKRMREIE